MLSKRRCIALDKYFLHGRLKILKKMRSSYSKAIVTGLIRGYGTETFEKALQSTIKEIEETQNKIHNYNAKIN